jgi:hypothetical protein
MDELIGIETGILGDGDGDLSEGFGVGLDGEGLLAFDGVGKFLTLHGHLDFRVSATVDNFFVFHCLY